MSTTYFDYMFESSNYGLDLDLDYFNDYNDYFLENEYDKYYDDYNYFLENEYDKYYDDYNYFLENEVDNYNDYYNDYNYFLENEYELSYYTPLNEGVIDSIRNWIKKIIEKIRAACKYVMEKIRSLFSKAKQFRTSGPSAKQIKDKAEEEIKKIDDKAEELKEKIKDKAEKERVENKAEEAKERIKNKAKEEAMNAPIDELELHELLALPGNEGSIPLLRNNQLSRPSIHIILAHISNLIDEADNLTPDSTSDSDIEKMQKLLDGLKNLFTGNPGKMFFKGRMLYISIDEMLQYNEIGKKIADINSKTSRLESKLKKETDKAINEIKNDEHYSKNFGKYANTVDVACKIAFSGMNSITDSIANIIQAIINYRLNDPFRS